MIARIAAAAILLAVPGTAVLADSPTAPSVQRGVDGRNVTRVFHSGGGSFEVTQDGRWFEFGDDGAIIHQFEERGRDRSRVDLFDVSRGTRVWIDLDQREISGAPAFGPQRLLYRILDVDAGDRGRGWRGRRGQGGTGGGWDRDDNGPGRGNGGWDRGPREIEVGPIWNQRDAETKCRNKARELRGEWNGQWRTTVQGRMSVCSIDTGGRGGNGNGGWNGGGSNNGGWNGGGNNGGGWGNNNGGTRDIEVGPIWNQRDAETKCRNKAREMRGEWNGQWRTTVQGRMSVCEIRFR